LAGKSVSQTAVLLDLVRLFIWIYLYESVCICGDNLFSNERVRETGFDPNVVLMGNESLATKGLLRRWQRRSMFSFDCGSLQLRRLPYSVVGGPENQAVRISR
jgi:hypothetical protein